MPFSDRVNQRLLFGLSVLVQVIGMSLLAIFPMTVPVVIVYLILVSLGAIFVQAFFQLWSAELFPTLLRSTAQGICFAIVRIAMGIWSFVVPVLASTQFTTLAWILTSFLVISGLIGLIWAPRNEGKSLRQVDLENGMAIPELAAHRPNIAKV
jgi:inositol transporter-like SP family MFS transporter